MGRSVMTVHDAAATAYRTHRPEESYYWQGWEEYAEAGWVDPEVDDFHDWMYGQWNDGDSEIEWEGLIGWIQSELSIRWPSLGSVEDEWLPDRETRVLARNRHSAVTIAEYGGVVAISLIPNYDRNEYWRNPDPALGEWWRSQVAPRFLKLFGEFRKIGTASNGESFYEAVT